MTGLSLAKRRSDNVEPRRSFGLDFVPVHQWLPTDFPISNLCPWTILPQSVPIDQLHIHDALEVGYCDSGTGVLVIEDRVIPFGPGDVSIVNDREMHMSRHTDGVPSHWTYFWCDPPALLASMPESVEIASQDVFAGADFPNIISPANHPEICRTVARIIEEMREQREPGYRTVVRGLAGIMMALLHRMCKETLQRNSPPAHTGIERISPALRYMANHYAEEIEVDELAEMCHLSVTHFRRVFLASVGSPPLQYLARLRVRMAAGILRERADQPVTAVASAVGFDSINTFNRHFLHIMGTSPRRWRRQASPGKFADHHTPESYRPAPSLVGA